MTEVKSRPKSKWRPQALDTVVSTYCNIILRILGSYHGIFLLISMFGAGQLQNINFGQRRRDNAASSSPLFTIYMYLIYSFSLCQYMNKHSNL